ncbi:MAG: XisI protein [Blastocatellia bacterium]
MDQLNQYREIIERILTEIVAVTERCSDADPNLRDKTVFDRRSDNYLILREGWVGPRHINLNVVHVEIINGKVWVQVDNTDQAIARKLHQAGIPKSDIVLGFQPATVRPHTEYAVA